MNITDVKVFLRESNQLKAFVNIVIDDAFIVRNIKVIEGDNGLFVAMPSRRVSSGEYRDIAHPINTETRNQIESVIIEKYKEVLQGALSSANEGSEKKVEKPIEEPAEKQTEEVEEKPAEEPVTE
jgi:stage V sporulation protein G